MCLLVPSNNKPTRHSYQPRDCSVSQPNSPFLPPPCSLPLTILSSTRHPEPLPRQNEDRTRLSARPGPGPAYIPLHLVPPHHHHPPRPPDPSSSSHYPPILLLLQLLLAPASPVPPSRDNSRGPAGGIFLCRCRYGRRQGRQPARLAGRRAVPVAGAESRGPGAALSERPGVGRKKWVPERASEGGYGAVCRDVRRRGGGRGLLFRGTGMIVMGTLVRLRKVVGVLV